MCIEGIEEISGGGGPTMPEEANEMEEAEHMAFFFLRRCPNSVKS